MLKYPVRVMPDTVGFYAVFKDIPEASTGAATYEETLEMAADALLVSMDFYFEDLRVVPMPSKAEEGGILIDLPLSVSAKIHLLNEMLVQGVSQSDLARRLGVARQEVTRIVNLHHATKIDTIANALKSLGKELHLSLA